MKIYVASSWRNTLQHSVVELLRSMGHEVYDFKHPRPDDYGFHWSEVDGGWQTWSPKQYIKALSHPIAKAGYKSDKDAMDWADTFVMVMPCGRSAHLEMGYAIGKGKRTIILQLDAAEPELMYKLADDIVTDLNDLIDFLKPAWASQR